ncbi:MULTISPECIES: asparaginase domain-containing protein [Thiomicrorhabdus]|uniref:Asparaginase n=1 Tax=Thiomicrorhabdus heinhorstiae TaxID=2748010 RepID=A0ABS0BV62_9GAMM|nr:MULTISPECIES: asparaginase domain-containing protein [Thiomicrorhabdus]MBF6056864.1 asparaginase [Thiomicrorhabdus heinhorstiae]
MHSQIHLLITGGTLDKDYHPLQGELYFPGSHIEEMLRQANCRLPVKCEILMQKDSLDMEQHDRAQIAEACLKSESTQILITHGTDTMVETALYLQNNPGLRGKTIVLTGAMRPFALGHSDALFNLGGALSAVQLKNSGVYICMNGRIFKADKATKNRALGVFEAI